VREKRKGKKVERKITKIGSCNPQGGGDFASVAGSRTGGGGKRGKRVRRNRRTGLRSWLGSSFKLKDRLMGLQRGGGGKMGEENNHFVGGGGFLLSFVRFPGEEKKEEGKKGGGGGGREGG